jgi:hypothetical protein
MRAATIRTVRLRAAYRCEYCLLSEGIVPLPFAVEHIVAKQYRGSDAPGNLAWSCSHCNLHKGPNVSGIDYPTSRVRPVRLFHPRLHVWRYHFGCSGPLIVGRTAIGRVTVHVLNMNAEVQLELRRLLIDEGLFPPV